MPAPCHHLDVAALAVILLIFWGEHSTSAAHSLLPPRPSSSLLPCLRCARRHTPTHGRRHHAGLADPRPTPNNLRIYNPRASKVSDTEPAAAAEATHAAALRAIVSESSDPRRGLASALSYLADKEKLGALPSVARLYNAVLAGLCHKGTREAVDVALALLDAGGQRDFPNSWSYITVINGYTKCRDPGGVLPSNREAAASLLNVAERRADAATFAVEEPASIRARLVLGGVVYEATAQCPGTSPANMEAL